MSQNLKISKDWNEDVFYLVFPPIVISTFINELDIEDTNIVPVFEKMTKQLSSYGFLEKRDRRMETLTRVLFLSRFNDDQKLNNGNLGELFPFFAYTYVHQCTLSKPPNCYHFPKIVQRKNIKWNHITVMQYINKVYDPVCNQYKEVALSNWKLLIELAKPNVVYVPADKSKSADLYIFFKQQNSILAIQVKSGVLESSTVVDECKKVFVNELKTYKITLLFVTTNIPDEEKLSKYDLQYAYYITSKEKIYTNYLVPDNCEIVFLRPRGLELLLCYENYSLWDKEKPFPYKPVTAEIEEVDNILMILKESIECMIDKLKRKRIL